MDFTDLILLFILIFFITLVTYATWERSKIDTYAELYARWVNTTALRKQIELQDKLNKPIVYKAGDYLLGVEDLEESRLGRELNVFEGFNTKTGKWRIEKRKSIKPTIGATVYCKYMKYTIIDFSTKENTLTLSAEVIYPITVIS